MAEAMNLTSHTRGVLTMIQRKPTKESRMRSHGPRQVVAGFIAVLAGTIGFEIPPASALPTGNLFVSSNLTDSVLEYNGVSGASMGAFVPSRSGGLIHPSFLTFGPASVSSVSDPATVLLLGSGLMGLAGWRWRQNSRLKLWITRGWHAKRLPTFKSSRLDNNLRLGSY